MQFIQQGKVGLLKSRPGYHYPNFRLPRDYQNLIGENYKIFTTSFEGAKAFLLVLPDIPSHTQESFTTNCKIPDGYILKNIENSIEEIKGLLGGKSERGDERGEAPLNGLVEIRTRDLRRVKATS